MSRDYLRTCNFRPYLKHRGPSFTLRTWYTGRTDRMGKSIIGYDLSMRDYYNAIGGRILKHWHTKPPVILFTGEDFHCSPMHCIDSDECIESIMGFLTLRPGDTDREYFKDYTPKQLAYCNEHAETLQVCCMDRFEPASAR